MKERLDKATEEKKELDKKIEFETRLIGYLNS